MRTMDEGMLRVAETALRVNGGCEVALRLPGLAGSGDDGEQLGLATPTFEDVPVGPAAWRKTGRDSAVLLSAGAVQQLVGSQQLDSAEGLFGSAVGVVVSGVLYAIAGCEAVLAAGVPVAYRVGLVAPVGVP